MTSLPDQVSAEELAELLGVTARTVRNHAARGIITKAGRGKFDLKSSIRGLLRHAEASRPEAESETARAELTRLKSREASLRLRLAEGEVIELDEAMGALDEVVGVYRAEFEGLPAKYSRDVKERAKLRGLINEGLARASKKFDELAQGLNNEG